MISSDDPGEVTAGRAPRPRSRRRRRARRVVAVMVAGAVGGEGYAFRHRIARAFADIQSVNPWWAVVAVAASLISMNCFARTQQRMLFASGSHVSIVRMVGLAYAANAVNWTFPGGTALSAGYVVNRLRAWGVSAPAAAFVVAASGVLSSLTFLGLTVVCAVLTSGGSYGSAVAAAAGVAVLIAAVTALWRRPKASTAVLTSALVRFNRLSRRPPERGTEAVQVFLTELTGIRLRRLDWLAGTCFASCNWIADLLCLVASCRAVDVGHASAALLVSAYLAGMTASSVSFVPGGFGVIDVAMVFALIAGGVTSAAATAGVLLYRLISCALLVGAGWVVWLVSRTKARHAPSVLSRRGPTRRRDVLGARSPYRRWSAGRSARLRS